jgi:hypothetical protein
MDVYVLTKKKKKSSHLFLKINIFFGSTLSEFENFLLCERILVNITTCQNKTVKKYRHDLFCFVLHHFFVHVMLLLLPLLLY